MDRPSPPAGVVLDFDGVILDTMTYHAEAYRRVLRDEAGVEIHDRDVFLQEGQDSARVLASLADQHDLGWSPARCRELAERKQRIFEDVQDARPYPGAFEVLDQLHEAGVTLGLVTGTDPRNVEAFLGERQGHFDVIVTAADVEASKPDPEPYERAVEALGLDPATVLVVENAPLGIRSARAAGTYVVAVETTLGADDLGEAHEVLHDLKNLLELAGGAP